MISGWAWLAVSASVTTTVMGVWLALRPPRRLGPRVRPYVTAARAELGRSPELFGPTLPGPLFGQGTIRRLLSPILSGIYGFLERFVPAGNQAELELRLRQAGLFPEVGEGQKAGAYRMQTLARGVLLGACLGIFAWLTDGSGQKMLFYGMAGFALGVFLSRSRLRNALRQRQEQIRSELYTINQLVAMRSRVGGGAGEAIRYVVGRAQGAMVDELAEILLLHRRGWSFRDAFERAARLAPEPEAVRTYRVMASCQERGADLSEALLSLAKDLRGSRRDTLRAAAARRRLLLVIPTVVVLAPVTLLFLAAPIPTLIFGG